jgi:ankyrin repeat protein
VEEGLLGKLAGEVDLNPHPILIKSRKAETALHLAAKNGHDAVVVKLLETLEHDGSSSPAVAMATKQEETALHLAAANGYVRVTSALLRPLSGNDRWMHAAVKENNGGNTPVAIAAEQSHWNVVKLLLATMENMGRAEFEADPTMYDRAMVTAAAYEEPGQERILRRLLQERSPPAESEARNRTERTKPSESWTVLHWAVYHGCVLVVWSLLAKGGHSGGREMKLAQAVARDLKDWEPIEIRRTIDELLQSPPPVSDKSIYYSAKESPTLSPQSAEQEEICKVFEGVIADFYQEKAEKYEGVERDRVRVLPIRRNVMDIIYNRGPKELMFEAQSYNRTRLDNLQKLVASNTASPSQGAADAQPKKIRDEAQKETEPQLLFRWVNIFANNVRTPVITIFEFGRLTATR